MNERGLLDLKEQIDEAKTKSSELKGQRDHLMKELKDVYDCQSTKQAEIKIDKLRKELEKIKAKIEDGLEKLEEMKDG